MAESATSPYIRWFRDIGSDDAALVGGKNASLGELYRELRSAGVRVPDGFAVTADAYRALVESGGLRERIATLLQGIDGRDVRALAAAGAAIRTLVEAAPWPSGLERVVVEAYAALGGGPIGASVAVRSSATAEDLPEASFAGQQETYLGVRGAGAVVEACRRCFASLFTDRAIAYRIDRGFEHLAVRLSIGVQRMVRSDLGASGVMFTLDPESGFRDVVLIEGAYGLGEAVVGGRLDPDELWLFKPTLGRGTGAILKRVIGRKDWKLVLGPGGRPERGDVDPRAASVMSVSDADAVELARAAVAIEAHYSRRRGEPTPMDIEWALLHRDRVLDAGTRDEIDALTRGYASGAEYFVDRLAEGVAMIAAAFYPKDVIVRLSDFKSNEYAGLLGGGGFEPEEGNPMLGFRGAYRYTHPRYREAFVLECRAMQRVRGDLGLTNLKLMVPFCRTPEEGRRVVDLMAQHGLRRGEQELEVYVMCEIPSNVILAREFAEIFDGFSIGSNDLTQLVLGLDRDSELVAPLFDERNPAVLAMVADVIATAHACGRKIGICGQAPSDYPEFARFLVERGIDSISLDPDAVVRGLETIAAAEQRSRAGTAARAR